MGANARTSGLLQDECGVFLLQFLLSCIMFFLLLFFCVDLTRWAYQNHVALYVVNEIGRDAAIWNMSGVTAEARAQDLITKTINKAGVMGLGLENSNVQVCPLASVTNMVCNVTTVGTPNEYFILQINRPNTVCLGLFPIRLSAVAVLRHEPNPAPANLSPGNPGPP